MIGCFMSSVCYVIITSSRGRVKEILNQYHYSQIFERTLKRKISSIQKDDKINKCDASNSEAKGPSKNRSIMSTQKIVEVSYHDLFSFTRRLY